MIKASCFALLVFRFLFISILFPGVLFITGGLSHAAAAEKAGIETEILPAKGTTETLLTIPAFGRYAVTVKSPQGSGLQIIDRMAGPGEVFGTPGESDGRVDAFLDRGVYKIRVHSHENGSGQAQLVLHSFKEINSPLPPRLVEHKRVDSQLADFQQRAYWMEIRKRRSVAIEAAGRGLSDLRIWRDGNWLVDAAPSSDVVEPHKGKPLSVKRLSTHLAPGLYQVIAYGGPALPWAQTSDAAPFHLIWGIPTSAEAGRDHRKAGPMGLDRFLVPRTASYFRLELPEAEAATISVTPFNPKNPFSDNGRVEQITKKSLPPVAEISTQREKQGHYLVTIRREAGKPYTLQHFDKSTEYRFKARGQYWISTLHSGHLQDSVDATALLFEKKRGQKTTLLSANTIALDNDKGWEGRFNLMAPLTLYLDVANTGKYTVSSEGAKARYRLEPFFIVTPDNYEPPDFEPGGHAWDLDPGIHVLTVKPESKGKGILSLRISQERLFGAPEMQPRRFASRFPDVQLDRKALYTLYMNRQPGVQSGVVLRRLPVDLTRALPITQHTGEAVSVSVSIPEKGKISALAEDGRLLDISVGAGSFAKQHDLSDGVYKVDIRHTGPEPVQYNLRFDADRLDTETPLPEMSPKRLAAIPRFTPLTENSPRYLDIKRDQAATFQVQVNQDGLYQLASTGLLETEGNIRTRTIVSYARRAANGVGRNFLIQEYLRQGDYQLTLRSRGKTEGHLGVELSRTPLTSGGALTAHIPARLPLAAGEGAVYQFHIPEKGRFRLQTLGQNRRFLCRLEDQEGWPLAAPGTPANFDMNFSPGTYRLVLLPQPVEARSVTLLEPIPPPPEREGHGPHTIRLNTPIQYVWMEPEPGAERIPDQWCFDLPAAVDAEISLSAEMTGIIAVKEGGEPLESDPALLPGKPWSGRMAAGSYCLEVKSFRPNNRLDYRLTVKSRQLVAGYERRITTPGELAISVGDAGVVELNSFGPSDVKARLFDTKGNLVARNDDQTADWNFHLAPTLEPGEYGLKVEPVGSANAETIVRMRKPEEIAETAISLPARTTITDTLLHTYPVQLSQAGGLFLARARSVDAVGLSLETQENKGWRQLGHTTGQNPVLAIARGPDPPASPLRLRIWSVDRRGAKIELAAEHFRPEPQTEEKMVEDGLTLTPVGDEDRQWGLFTIAIEQPGLFQFNRPTEKLLLAAAPGRQLMQSADIFPATGNRIWGMASMDRKVLRGQRIGLQPGEPLHLTLPDDRKVRIDLPKKEKGRDLLVQAQSRSGVPGITIWDGQSHNTSLLMGTDKNTAVTIATEKTHTGVLLWRADQGKDGLEVMLRAIPFDREKQATLSQGIADLALNGRIAGSFELPAGTAQLKLTLPARTAAALVHDSRMTDLLWAGDAPKDQTLTTSAQRLVLYYDGTDSAMAGVSLAPALSGAQTRLNGHSIFSRYFAEKGAHRIAVELPEDSADNGNHLMLRGAEVNARYTDRDGRIFTGARIPVTGSGILTLFHGDGLAAAWLEGDSMDPWRSQVHTPSAQVTEATQAILKGTGAGFTVPRNDPALLHLSTACPVMVRINTGKASPRTVLFENGALLSHFLPAGNTEVILMAPGQGNLSGTARFTFTEVTPMVEGLGPRIRLAPGGARLFSFTANVQGQVGIGVRGTSDRTTCRLMTPDGALLGTGRVQIHDLSPGRYFLAVENPPGGDPLEVRPAVVGIQPPDKDPPEAVIREYMDLGRMDPVEQQ